jgi:hypothetical protein
MFQMAEIYNFISRPAVLAIVVGLFNLATALLGIVRGHVYFGTFVFYRRTETAKYFMTVALFSVIGILLLNFGFFLSE